MRSRQTPAGVVALQTGAAILVIAAITFLDERIPGVNSTTVALTFLLAILFIATGWGLVQACAASVAAVLCLNYFFLPPFGTLTIADPQNWVALFVFLVTSIVASQLSVKVKRRALDAMRRQQEMEKLYDLGRAVLLLDTTAGVPSQIVQQVTRVFSLTSAALFDRETDRVYAAGPQADVVTEAKMRDVALQRTEYHDIAADVSFVPVALGGTPVGSLAIQHGVMSDAALHAIANLVAITLERGRAQELAARAEAERQNQVLKSILLDALAHEFKTPLTAIKAAVSSMLAAERVSDRELLTIIEEETDRLNSLVTETTQMARIEAGQLQLDRQPLGVSQIAADALRKAERALQDREVRVDVPASFAPVLADAELISLVLRQLLSNSLKYADPESPIEIRARHEGDQVVITVSDRGPGIPEREQARIFERFYRIPGSSAGIPGTGMGLAIARDIVEAHGGTLKVESRAGEGSQFSFSLPLAPASVSR